MMTYQAQIEELFQKNAQLIDEINQVIKNIEIQDNEYRKILFMTYFSIVTEHFIAIDILFEKRCIASAFAMVRIFFDSNVRCLYLYYCFNTSEIDKFYNEKKSDFPKTKKMCEKLDEKLEYCFNEIREQHYGKMCDYTHTGYAQATQFINENTCQIEVTHDIELIKNTVKSNHVLMNILKNELIKNLKVDF